MASVTCTAPAGSLQSTSSTMSPLFTTAAFLNDATLTVLVKAEKAARHTGGVESSVHVTSASSPRLPAPSTATTTASTTPLGGDGITIRPVNAPTTTLPLPLAPAGSFTTL